MQATVAATETARKQETLVDLEKWRAGLTVTYAPLKKAVADLKDALPKGTSKTLWTAAKELFEETLSQFGYGVMGEPKYALFQKLDDTKREELTKLLDRAADKVWARCEHEMNNMSHSQQVERELDQLKPYLRSGVPPITGTSIREKFPVDLTGWKYGDEAILAAAVSTKLKVFEGFESGDDEKKAFLHTMREQIRGNKAGWKTITVSLTLKPDFPNAAGWWKGALHELTLVVPISVYPHQLEESLIRTLHHELTHMAQTLLQDSVSNASWYDPKTEARMSVPGMPPKSIATPGYAQKSDNRGLGVRGPSVSELHSLDDVEFFTDLRDAIEDAKDQLLYQASWLKEHYKRESTAEERKLCLEWFVWHIQRWPLKEAKMPERSKAFGAWKKYAPEKWKRGVKELFKVLHI